MGNGSQSIRLASWGAEVYGIDIAINMLRVAEYRILQGGLSASFFHSESQFLPFRKNSFDMIVCSGSVLNYTGNYLLAIDEFARVLKGRGILVLGIDNALSLDILCLIVDKLSRGGLGYKARASDVAARFVRSGDVVLYPYITLNGTIRQVPERFFRLWDLSKHLKGRNIRVIKRYGIHLISSLLPFTLISNPQAPIWVKKTGMELIRIDRYFCNLPVLNKFAYHIVIIGVKH